MLKSKTLEMTVDEFLVWNLSQDERYELVDGYPFPMHAQAGATQGHDMIVVNLIRHLANRLVGKPCRPATADLAVRTSIRRSRRPDVTIECAPLTPSSLEAREPVAVFEVTSPSNRAGQTMVKIEDYKRHPSIRHIVLIEPGVVSVTLLSRRDGSEWTDSSFEELADTLRLDPPGVELPLTEIYEGAQLTAEPPLAEG